MPFVVFGGQKNGTNAGHEGIRREACCFIRSVTEECHFIACQVRDVCPL